MQNTIIIEVKHGVVQTITATENCSVYIVDHDELSEQDLSGMSVEEILDEYQPDEIIDESEVYKTLQRIVDEIRGASDSNTL